MTPQWICMVKRSVSNTPRHACLRLITSEEERKAGTADLRVSLKRDHQRCGWYDLTVAPPPHDTSEAADGNA